MKKLGTSRWREAVRSGEISPEAGQRVMRSLGVTPEEWAQRLGRGARQAAERAGFSVVEVPSTFWKTVARAAAKPPSLPGALPYLNAVWVTAKGGTPVTNQFLKSIFVPETPAIGHGWPELALLHEAREAQHMNRRYDVASRIRGLVGPEKPTTYARILPEKYPKLKTLVASGAEFNEKVRPVLRRALEEGLFGNLSALHTSPEIPIRDIREARLLPTDTRKFLESIRRDSGELADIAAAAKQPGVSADELRLPRHRVREMAKTIQGMQAQRSAEIAGAEASPRVRAVARIVKKLLRR